MTFVEPALGRALSRARAACRACCTPSRSARVPVRLRAGHRSRIVSVTGAGRPTRAEPRPRRRRGGRCALPPDGLVLSQKLAEVLDVAPGDAVTVEVLEGGARCGRCRWPALVDDYTGTVGLHGHRRAAPPDARGRDAVSGAFLRSTPARPATSTQRSSGRRPSPAWRSSAPPRELREDDRGEHATYDPVQRAVRRR